MNLIWNEKGKKKAEGMITAVRMVWIMDTVLDDTRMKVDITDKKGGDPESENRVDGTINAYQM